MGTIWLTREATRDPVCRLLNTKAVVENTCIGFDAVMAGIADVGIVSSR